MPLMAYLKIVPFIFIFLFLEIHGRRGVAYVIFILEQQLLLLKLLKIALPMPEVILTLISHEKKKHELN